MDPDVSLAARLASDLERAFPALVDAHASRLYTIAHRLLGVPADAEEVAQDALIRAHRALAGYDAARISALRLRPWLATITINLARNRRRRIADRLPATSLGPLIDAGLELSRRDLSEPADAGPAASAERAETRQRLAGALLQLRPATRAAVVLRHVDGLTVAETAATLGRPEGTVKAQVHRGLATLRLILDQSDRQSTRSARPPLPAAAALRPTAHSTKELPA